MYALIYDDRTLNDSQKKVISVHASRRASEKALSKRQRDLGKNVWECRTRIIWTDKAVAAEDVINTSDFVSSHSNETALEGELNSHADF